MGDTVLMTAALSALKSAFPRADIDVCVTAAWAPLLEQNPAIRKIIPFERRTNRRARLRSLMKLGFELRSVGYDAVLNLHASPSSSAMALATFAKIRAVHFHGHTDRNRYSTVTIPDKGVLKPIIERDLDVVRALGAHVAQDAFPTQIFLSDAERAAAATKLKDLGLTGPILALGLGASRDTKRWSTANWVELARRWTQARGGSVLALGAQDEAPLIAEWLTAVGAGAAPTQFAALTDLSVRELAQVLSQVTVLAGNDSGPRHIAVAIGRPTVTLFGPEDPFEWHPYPRREHPSLFVPHLPCRRDASPGYPAWCGLHTCTVERHRCMTEITVDQVWETLKGVETS